MKNVAAIGFCIVGCLLFYFVWQIFWRTSFVIMDITKNAFLPFVLIGIGAYWFLGRRKNKR